MRHANRGDARIVDDSSNNVWAAHESAQDIQEIRRLADHPN